LKRLIIAIGVITAMVFGFLASQPRTASIEFSGDDFLQNNGVIVGELEINSFTDYIEVTLHSDQTAGFKWEIVKFTDEMVWPPDDHKYEPPETEGLVGAAGKEIWIFPRDEGILTMEYRQPWDGGTKAERTLHLYIFTIKPETASIEFSNDDFLQNDGAIVEELEISDSIDYIEVILYSNPTTGFRWEIIEVPDETAWTPYLYRYEPAETEGLVGAAGKEIWIFPRDEGILTMEYSQPWDGGTKAEWTLNLPISTE